MKSLLLSLFFTVLFSAEFKLGTYGNDGKSDFAETTEIIISRTGVCYGWQTTSLNPGASYEIEEAFRLPVAPATWGNREDGRPYTVSNDKLVATTIVSGIVGKDGVVRSRWWAVPGDPPGNHVIKVKYNGEVKEFKFSIKYGP